MTARDRTMLTVMAVVAVTAAAWFLVVAPKRAELARADDAVAAAQTRLDTATQQTAASAQARRRYGADTAAVAALGKAVPETDDTAELLHQLNAAAGRSRVRLRSISPSAADPTAATAAAPAVPAGVTALSVSLGFDGRFADLRRFLQRIHAATRIDGDDVRVRGRLLSIGSVQLTPGDGGRVTAVVQATAYMEPPVAAAAAPAAAASAPTTASTAPPTQAAMIGAPG